MVYQGLKDQIRPSQAKHGEWLPREETKHDPGYQTGNLRERNVANFDKLNKTHQGLNAGHPVVSGVAQETAKCNNWGEIGKVEEDDG